MLEEAVVGTPAFPGLMEMARTHSSKIEALEASIESVNTNVLEVRDYQRQAAAAKQAERDAFIKFRNIAYVLLILLGAGGTALGGKIISILDALK